MAVDMSAGLAAKEFRAAVEVLVEPSVYWDGGVVRRVPGLYQRVRGQLNGKRGGARAVASSRPPCDLHGLDWLRRIDGLVAEWHGGGTIYALQTVSLVDYSPDDVPLLHKRTQELVELGVEASDIVGDTEKPVPLRKACPLCSETWRYTSDGTRKWALTVTADGAQCHSCSAAWSLDALPLLARLLEA